MKILIVAEGYPSKKYPMNGVFAFDQAKAMSKLGHEVIFAAVDCRSIRRWRKFGYEHKEIEGIKIYVFNVPLGPFPEWILRNIGVLFLEILYNIIEHKEGKPDIVHGHFGLRAGYASAKLCSKQNLPLVITEHDSGINEGKISNNDVIRLKYVYQAAREVVAVGSCLENRIKDYTNVDAIIIPNIVDTACFNFKPKKEHQDFNFVSVGRLISRKGMDFLITAFHTAFQGNRNVNLFIYGEGVEQDTLSKQINSLGMANRIRLMGSHPRHVIAEKFEESDCFVLASRCETFGVVFIEALSSGIPVIATICGGPEDFVDEINGSLVKVDDKEELVDALRYMYHNANRYDGFQISNHTMSLFSPATIAGKLTQLYERVLQTSVRL